MIRGCITKKNCLKKNAPNKSKKNLTKLYKGFYKAVKMFRHSLKNVY